VNLVQKTGSVRSQEEADEIISRIESYGLMEFDVYDLKKRLASVQHTPSPIPFTPTSGDIVRITVVGGDERHAKYDKDLKTEISEWDKHVDVRFYHTNWSSNHGDQLSDMKPQLDKSDAVVILRLIRTNLGRNLRKYCPVWIGCSGDSRSSIRNAIRRAVYFCRTKKNGIPSHVLD